jgi:hypothetical protein
VSHTCHARGCAVFVKPEFLMCGRHWKMVPARIQRAVYRHYRPGQCDDMNPSKEWHEAANAAIGTVAKRESYGVSKNEERAMVVYNVTLLEVT